MMDVLLTLLLLASADSISSNENYHTDEETYNDLNQTIL